MKNADSIKPVGRTSAEEEEEEEEVRAAIEERVDTGVKEEVVDIYDDLMETIWSKITPTLGVVTVRTIMERAIFKTSQKHSIITAVKVTGEGVDFSELKSRVGERERAQLRDAFKEFVANLFDILAKLTGNVLVNQLLKEVEGLQ